MRCVTLLVPHDFVGEEALAAVPGFRRDFVPIPSLNYRVSTVSELMVFGVTSPSLCSDSRRA